MASFLNNLANTTDMNVWSGVLGGMCVGIALTLGYKELLRNNRVDIIIKNYIYLKSRKIYQQRKKGWRKMMLTVMIVAMIVAMMKTV